jgi:hypothetical protein
MLRNLGLGLGSVLLVVVLTAGCGGIQQKSPSDDVRAFFMAANEAKFLGARQCLSPHSLDLSAYAHLMNVRYPPTLSVDVLTGPPSRPYQPFAVLEGSNPLNSKVAGASLIEDFKNKAREIGADAIIICQPTASKIEAVAIKYRLEEVERKQ